jgi:haloalkane dehalogenase
MPWRDLYPFDPHYLTLPGGQLHYLDEGAGQPLLFVHGNPTWSFYWRNLILGLRDRNRCVAVDHIGCGSPTSHKTTTTRCSNESTTWCNLWSGKS